MMINDQVATAPCTDCFQARRLTFEPKRREINITMKSQNSGQVLLPGDTVRFTAARQTANVFVLRLFHFSNR